MDYPKVVLITGPIGSGKSTSARAIAKRLGSCVDIDIEAVNYMIVDGFEAAMDAQGNEVLNFTKWGMSGALIGVMVKKLQESGNRAVIHGRVNDELVKAIEKHVVISHKVLLMPDLDTAINRDSKRGRPMSIGESAVRADHAYYRQFHAETFKRFDTTQDDESTTVGKLLAFIQVPQI